MTPQQAPEESLSRSPIPSGLQIHINDLAVLVYSPPQVILLVVDLDEDLIDEESIAVALMLSFQPTGV